MFSSPSMARRVAPVLWAIVTGGGTGLGRLDALAMGDEEVSPDVLGRDGLGLIMTDKGGFFLVREAHVDLGHAADQLQRQGL